jgi:hypothetical protein
LLAYMARNTTPSTRSAIVRSLSPPVPPIAPQIPDRESAPALGRRYCCRPSDHAAISARSGSDRGCHSVSADIRALTPAGGILREHSCASRCVSLTTSPTVAQTRSVVADVGAKPRARPLANCITVHHALNGSDKLEYLTHGREMSNADHCRVAGRQVDELLRRPQGTSGHRAAD